MTVILKIVVEDFSFCAAVFAAVSSFSGTELTLLNFYFYFYFFVGQPSLTLTGIMLAFNQLWLFNWLVVSSLEANFLMICNCNNIGNK